ncbi:MAG: efflux RND transporter periplasmic adaptor subunit [Calditrichaceae bacterium]|nr:efflux RND transporter periplasmic adaptor subunit [Calditrichaceae bacterium]
MKTKRIIWTIITISTIAAGLFTIIYCTGKTADKEYQLTEVTKTDIVNIVSCSGTLEAVGTVEVGTQVSGVIDHIYVDFNDKVKKNQVLALLDTVLLKAQVIEAQANYQKADAQLQEAKAEHDRNKALFDNNLISEAEFMPYRINLKIQQASLTSAKAALLRADRNLKYAVVRSPINGTIIERSVEEGQTVAASLQAPTLFIIADDLSKMEIHAQVDESDIGQIKKGQRATFEVQAYIDKQFEGTVRQVRLQPEVVQNVVNYTVIVDASNPEGLLLPGMTATIDFYIEELKDVLAVPNTALGFQPSEQVLAAFRERMQKQFAARSDSTQRPRFNPDSEGGSGFGAGRFNPNDMGSVWFLNDGGEPEMAFFRKGKTDGKFTEILGSRRIVEGMKLITGYTDPSKEAEATTQQNSGRRFGPPGLF